MKLIPIYFSGYGITPEYRIKPWCVSDELLLHGKGVRLRDRLKLEAESVGRFVKSMAPVARSSGQH